MLKMYDASQLVSSQRDVRKPALPPPGAMNAGAAYGRATTSGTACAARLSATARRCRSVEPAIAGLETAVRPSRAELGSRMVAGVSRL